MTEWKKRVFTEAQKERRRQRAKERSQYQREHGLCRACGGKAEDGKRLCRKCSEFENARNRAIRKDRREKGLCTQCGKPLSEKDKKDGFKRCFKCRSWASDLYFSRNKK